MRIRNPITRSGAKHTWKFPSRKMARTIYCESPLERDLACLLELDNDVISYSEQPVRLDYINNGTAHWHVPDFAVQRRSGRELVEVKPARKAADPKIAARTAILIPLLAQHGIRYFVADERWIRTQPRLSNAKLLLRYRLHPVPRSQIDNVESALRDPADGGRAMAVRDLVRNIANLTFADVCALIARGVLFTADQTIAIGGNTQVGLKAGEDRQ